MEEIGLGCRDDVIVGEDVVVDEDGLRCGDDFVEEEDVAFVEEGGLGRGEDVAVGAMVRLDIEGGVWMVAVVVEVATDVEEDDVVEWCGLG